MAQKSTLLPYLSLWTFACWSTRTIQSKRPHPPRKEGFNYIAFTFKSRPSISNGFEHQASHACILWPLTETFMEPEFQSLKSEALISPRIKHFASYLEIKIQFSLISKKNLNSSYIWLKLWLDRQVCLLGNSPCTCCPRPCPCHQLAPLHPLLHRLPSNPKCWWRCVNLSLHINEGSYNKPSPNIDYCNQWKSGQLFAGEHISPVLPTRPKREPI